MFDIGFWELAIIGVVALLILGPERLPRAARTAGLWLSKAKRTFSDMKSEIERELDLEELKKVRSATQLTELDKFVDETNQLFSEPVKTPKRDTGSDLKPAENTSTPTNSDTPELDARSASPSPPSSGR